jgi:hypothetical protein
VVGQVPDRISSGSCREERTVGGRREVDIEKKMEDGGWRILMQKPDRLVR